MTEISVTLKAHGGYDSPWIVVKADTVAGLSDVLKELRESGAFVGVKTMAAEFTEAPAVGAGDPVELLKRELGGKVIEDQAADVPPTNAAAPAAAAVNQSTPPCEHCGAPTTYRSGNHPQSGAWEGYFCTSGNRTHTRFIK